MSYHLHREAACAEFDDQARLLSLTTSGAPVNPVTEPFAYGFRMTLRLGDCMETLVSPERQARPDIQADGDTLRIRHDTLVAFDGQRLHTLPIALTLTVSLGADERLTFGATIRNDSDAQILDFTYPCIGKIRTLTGPAPALLMPAQAGLRYQNIGRNLGGRARDYENSSNSISAQHPATASMSWMALTDDVCTLFLSSRDRNFFPTNLRVQGEPGQDTVTLKIERYLCLSPGQSLEVGDTVLDLYAGTWHKGARDYAEWMRAYRPEHPVPEWIRNMAGLFLVINKQQFGFEMWPYDTLGTLHQHAKANGCDTLGLFGWYHSGHDNQYPDLEVSPTLGGADALRDHIAAVQKDGGHVFLYYQGHLIDETSPYYREGDGREVASKNIWGSAYVDFYSKSHYSDMLRDYSRKVFHVACPSSEKWRKLMVERQNWLASFGADGCLYDQIGGCASYICFDPTHNHPLNNPALALTGGRRKLLDELQTNSKQTIGPEFAFFSEHITDLYSAYLDAVHGINAAPGGEGAFAAVAAHPEEVRTLNYPALFRYCFPDTIITVRNPSPRIPQRMANYALAFGFRPEMEIRYQTDREELLADVYAEERVYAQKLSALRLRYPQLLLRGRFVDTDLIGASNPALIATSFVAEDGQSMAVVLWNDTDAAQSTQPFAPVDGWRFLEYETPDGTAPELPETMPARAIAVALFQKV